MANTLSDHVLVEYVYFDIKVRIWGLLYKAKQVLYEYVGACKGSAVKSDDGPKPLNPRAPGIEFGFGSQSWVSTSQGSSAGCEGFGLARLGF